LQPREKKVGLVTGGARGIGRAIAEALAPELDALVIADIDGAAAADCAAAIRAHGHRVLAVEVDVASEISVADLAEKCRSEVGVVNTLVNNAGVAGLRDGRKPTCEEHTLSEWGRSIAVNLTSIFLMIRAFSPGMRSQCRGRIINIASAAGRVHIPFAPGPYSAAKAGVIALTRTLADELGPFGITVNAIAPGRIDTAMGSSLKRDSEYLEKIPLRRAGDPQDVAEAVRFLASEAASYITGATLDVGGGLYMV
jgi:3-oxoacyl-[acyl-carrier protein] reductase